MTFDVAERATWPEFMTVEEVAQVLRLHPSTVRRFARRPDTPIPLVELSSQEHRIAKTSLLRLLDSPPDPPSEE